jgi:hypothetical protein
VLVHLQNASLYVQTLLAVYYKYHNLIATAFNSNVCFRTALDKVRLGIGLIHNYKIDAVTVMYLSLFVWYNAGVSAICQQEQRHHAGGRDQISRVTRKILRHAAA